MKKDPKIIIVIVNWNGYKDTIECLHSLKKLSYPNFQEIIVDNHSTDGSREKIRAAFPEVPIFEMEENLGFAGGNNVGIEWAIKKKADWILLLNNDTKVDPHLLDALVHAAKEKPNGGIFGAKILKYDAPEKIDHLGGYWDQKKGEFFSFEGEDHPFYEMKKADYVCGACLFLKKELAEKIGLLEPKFFLFWEETDYCYRAFREGFEIWTVPNAKIWHKVSSSFTGGKPHTHYFWWRSRLLFLKRNCSEKEKKEIYTRLIFPEIRKMIRHLLIKSIVNLFSPSKKRKEEIKKNKAGLSGAFDYFRKKFGNCPSWLLKKR